MIQLKNIKKSFGSLVAVDDLSLEIKMGEVFGLLGPNGAGKSTTVNIAVGLLSQDEGSVNIGDSGSPVNPQVRRKIGVAPQSLALYDELTAEENLSFFGQLYSLSGNKLKSRVEWALKFVDLYDRRKNRAETFSGGMKRRLNLAIALIHDPSLIILDEPTVGVDPQSRNAIFEKIVELRKEGRTIVYTTHYMEEAQKLCDRVGIIDHGKLLALDTVKNLIKIYGGKSLLTIVTKDGENEIETNNPLVELMKYKENKNLLSFQLESSDLESVFLHLTGRHLRD